MIKATPMPVPTWPAWHSVSSSPVNPLQLSPEAIALIIQISINRLNAKITQVKIRHRGK
jgi:hypothetical protein